MVYLYSAVFSQIVEALVACLSCYLQVGKEFTTRMDLDWAEYAPPEQFPAACGEVGARPSHRAAVVNACVYVHLTLHRANARLAKRANRTMAITPRHYLDFIQQMVKLYAEKRADLEEQQLHLNVGLGKIAETVEQVEEMQKSLAVKSQVLNITENIKEICTLRF